VEVEKNSSIVDEMVDIVINGDEPSEKIVNPAPKVIVDPAVSPEQAPGGGL